MFFEPTIIFDKWRSWNESLFRRAFTTVGLIVLALILTRGIWLIVDRPVSSPLFLVAIAVTAWICGLRYGVVSAVICGVVIDYFFFTPMFQFSGSRDEMVRLIVFVFEGAVISWLVERLRLAGETITSKNLELRALTDHQQRLREDEQKRIAREVHDELGQSLTGLKMNMHLLKCQINARGTQNSSVEKSIDDLMQLTDSTIKTVKRIASDLRPSLLDDFGLVSAVEWQTQEFERRTSIPCTFESDCDAIDLGSEGNTAMYRVVQEALTNIARHADADSVSVDLATTSSEVRISISDDGKGIDTSSRKAPSLGLIGMQERSRMIGGELQIAGSPSEGTTITLTVPHENGHNGNGKH
jgi:Signal transduction histidine kinase